MVLIRELWLPILLSAIVVFIASSIIHMVLRYHRSDYKPLPDEAKTLDGLRKENIPPGFYVFPYCSSSGQMGSPEMIEKYRKGPVGLLTMLPNRPPAMLKALILWFCECLFVGLFVAYLTTRTLDSGTAYLAVFRIAGAAAFLAYAVGEPVNTIWRGQAWSTTFKNMFDGLVYALLTAGIFGWLWPAA